MKKADKPEKREFQLEVELETRGKIEEQSNVEAVKKGEDKESKYTQSLLELVMSKPNLNEAYMKVKRNKGAAGIDKLEVKDLLSYLQEQGI